MVTGSYTRTVHVPLQLDQVWYRLEGQPDYVCWVTQVWDRDRHCKLTKTDVVELTARDPDWLTTTGYPVSYMQIGTDYLGVYMVPSASGAVLEVTMACIPKAYSTDGGEIKVSDGFQRATVSLAISEFYASRGDANRANEYYAKYLETANLMQLSPTYQPRIYQFGGYQGGRDWRKNAEGREQ